MEFDLAAIGISKRGGAGSVWALMQDESIVDVYGVFADGCLRCYNMDIRNMRRQYFTTVVLRQVRSFASDYGVENAKGILKQLFGVAHEGVWNGKVVGKSIFSKGFRWLADILLLEYTKSNAAGGIGDGCSGATSAEFEAFKAGIKSFTTPDSSAG